MGQKGIEKKLIIGKRNVYQLKIVNLHSKIEY